MSTTVPSLDLRARRRSLMAASFGNTLEWYEWSIYSVFAPFIAVVMFDDSDPVSALLSTFAIFAAGFLMRPLGGMVFGHLADRIGRKTVLVTTLLLMGAGCFVMGIAPTFDQVGVWASALLLLARLVQGFAHGGESATSSSYIPELAPTGRRGLWSSSYFMALLSGTVLATVVGLGVILSFGEQGVVEGAWRYPFLLGGVLAVVVLFLRRGMDESEAFQAHRVEQVAPAAAEVAPVRRRAMLRPALTAIALICGLTVTQYTWLSFVSTHAIVHTGMDAASAYKAMIVAQLVALVTLPFWGKLSDRVGRRPLFLGMVVVLGALHFPLMNSVSADSSSLLVAATVALVLIAATGAIQATAMAELFPTRSRSLGIGIAFSLSVAVFGGSAPYLNELAYSNGVGWVANLYVVGSLVVTGLAAWWMPEGRDVDLTAVGAPGSAEVDRDTAVAAQG